MEDSNDKVKTVDNFGQCVILTLSTPALIIILKAVIIIYR